MVGPTIYTFNEFALRYRITSLTLHKAIRSKQIRTVMIGAAMRIPDPGWKIMRFYAERVLHMEHFLRTQEVKRLLNVSKSRIDELIEFGRLNPVMCDGRRYYSLADVIKCANRRQRYMDTNPNGGFPKKGTGKRTRDLVMRWAMNEAQDLTGTILCKEKSLTRRQLLLRQEEAAEVWLMPSGD